MPAKKKQNVNIDVAIDTEKMGKAVSAYLSDYLSDYIDDYMHGALSDLGDVVREATVAAIKKKLEDPDVREAFIEQRIERLLTQ